jgi:hypothetical protein
MPEASRCRSLAWVVAQIYRGRCVWLIGILRLRFCFAVREAKSSAQDDKLRKPEFSSTSDLLFILTLNMPSPAKLNLRSVPRANPSRVPDE